MAPPMSAAASAGMELCAAAPLVHATKNRARRRSSPRARGRRHNPSSSPLLQTGGTALAGVVTLRPAPASEPEPEPAGELVEGEPELDRSAAQPTQSTTTNVFDVGSVVAYCDEKVSRYDRQPKVIVKIAHIDHAAEPLVCHTIELPGGAQRQVGRHELHLLMFQKYQLTHKPTEVLDPDDPDRVSDEHRSSRDRFGVGSRGCDHLEGKHAARLAASHDGLTWEVRFHENFITEVTPADYLRLSDGKNPEGYDWHHNGQRDLGHSTGVVTLMPRRVHQGGGHGKELHQQTESEIDRDAFKKHQRPATNEALADHLLRLWLQTEGSHVDFCNRLAADHVWSLGKIDGIGKSTVEQLTCDGYTKLDHFRRDDHWKEKIGVARSRKLESRISEILQNRLPYDDHEYRGSFSTAS
eukprot:COSAG02_NODE_3783_length_6235_cov_20.382823_3_plen_411_part_00